jgi:hypothetical protein
MAPLDGNAPASNSSPQALHEQWVAMLKAKLRDAEQRLQSLDHERADLERTIRQLSDAVEAASAIPPAVLGVSEEEEAAAGDSEPQATNFERITQYLMRQTAPKTIAEIEQATGVRRSSVSAVVYRTHPNYFTRWQGEGMKPNTWSLKPTFRAEGDSGLVEDEPPF